jgi:hypothetical protein
MANITHHCANNDVNGNPQRCYVLTDLDDQPVAVWDEGYLGHHAVPGIWRDAAYNAPRINCSVAKYRRLLRTLPSPKWAHDVPGYSHLRELV